MPRLERDGLVAETRHDGIALEGRVKGNTLRLSVEDMRWLLATALPTLITSLEGPEPVPDAIRQGYREVREQ